jgi:hypothetical protein
MPSLNFNIPADKQADVIAALKKKYGVPAATTPQLISLMEAELKRELTELYRNYMKRKTFDVSFD